MYMYFRVFGMICSLFLRNYIDDIIYFKHYFLIIFLILAAAVGGWIVEVCMACPANTVLAAFQGIQQ